MFTVVTTKRPRQQQSASSSPEVKTVGSKSLDALVSDAWEQIKLKSIDRVPDGPGWLTTNQLAEVRGISQRSARELVQRERDSLDVFNGKLGRKTVAFYRPKSLAKIA